MRISTNDADDSSPSYPHKKEPTATSDAFLSALKLAGWQGLEMWVRDFDGISYVINAQVIIGSNFVQFAAGMSLEPVRIPLDRIAAFELP